MFRNKAVENSANDQDPKQPSKRASSHHKGALVLERVGTVVQNTELLLIRTILKASERKRITATQDYHRTNRRTESNSRYKRRENMTKVGIIVLADTDTHADIGRVANVLETAKV